MKIYERDERISASSENNRISRIGASYQMKQCEVTDNSAAGKSFAFCLRKVSGDCLQNATELVNKTSLFSF